MQLYWIIWDMRRRQWHPTPVLLPGRSHGQRTLVGCSPWGRRESDMTDRLPFPCLCLKTVSQLNTPSSSNHLHMTLSQFLHKLRGCAVGRFLPLLPVSLEENPSGGSPFLSAGHSSSGSGCISWIAAPPAGGLGRTSCWRERMLPGTLISFYR